MGDVDIVTDSATAPLLRQVKGPIGLVDIVTTNDTNYSISFFGIGALGNGGAKLNGLYVVTNKAVPLRSYQIINPSGATNNPN